MWILCDKCGETLSELGGLAFSPPTWSFDNTVNKFHICIKCWEDFEKWLKNET
jgi:hypothetical protein